MRIRILPVALIVTSLASGCGGADTGTVTVLAASSLTDAFSEIETVFEEHNPDVELQISFAASSTLREQILEEAPADVYASADPSNMAAVVDAGLATAPRPLATNRIALAVPTDNPAEVTGPADLADDSLLFGRCAPQVPCGRLADEFLAGAAVQAAADTEEPNVRSLVTKLEAAELDVALVYATDVQASERLVEVATGLPPVTTTYLIATVGAGSPAAERFVEFVLSPTGQSLLTEAGFGPP